MRPGVGDALDGRFVQVEVAGIAFVGHVIGALIIAAPAVEGGLPVLEGRQVLNVTVVKHVDMIVLVTALVGLEEDTLILGKVALGKEGFLF